MTLGIAPYELLVVALMHLVRFTWSLKASALAVFLCACNGEAGRESGKDASESEPDASESEPDASVACLTWNDLGARSEAPTSPDAYTQFLVQPAGIVVNVVRRSVEGSLPFETLALPQPDEVPDDRSALPVLTEEEGSLPGYILFQDQIHFQRCTERWESQAPEDYPSFRRFFAFDPRTGEDQLLHSVIGCHRVVRIGDWLYTLASGGPEWGLRPNGFVRVSLTTGSHETIDVDFPETVHDATFTGHSADALFFAGSLRAEPVWAFQEPSAMYRVPLGGGTPTELFALDPPTTIAHYSAGGVDYFIAGDTVYILEPGADRVDERCWEDAP